MSTETDEQAIEAFAVAARQFCGLLERQLAAEEIALALADLHVRALRLPDRFPEDDDREDPPDPATPGRRGSLPELPVDIYWVFLEPLGMEPGEAGAGSLADDLGDIRRELARGLRLFDAGRVIAACSEWRFGFHAHWGAHLVGAQMVLHTYLHR